MNIDHGKATLPDNSTMATLAALNGIPARITEHLVIPINLVRAYPAFEFHKCLASSRLNIVKKKLIMHMAISTVATPHRCIPMWRITDAPHVAQTTPHISARLNLWLRVISFFDSPAFVSGLQLSGRRPQPPTAATPASLTGPLLTSTALFPPSVV